MCFWTYAHFLSFALYFLLAGFVLFKNFQSSLNRTCAGILIAFGVWSFGTMALHERHSSYAEVSLMMNISSLGWFSFSAFGLWFILIFTERGAWLRKKWFLPLLFSPPILLTYQQWVHGAVIYDFVKLPRGWAGLWSSSPWTYLFYVYYTSLMLAILVLLYDYHGKSADRTRKVQAKIIALTALFPFVCSSITNVTLPRLYDDYRFAAVGDLLTLTFAFGIVYAVVRYKFMVITPAMAAEKIISTMSDSLLLLDTGGKIVTANEAAVDMLGYAPEEIAQKPVGTLFEGKEQSARFLDAMKKGDSAAGLDVVWKKKNGAAVPMLLSTSALRDDKGELAGMVCIARDMTEHRKAEEDRKHLITMREREEMSRWLHDHLGADLFNISLVAEMSNGRSTVNPDVLRQLEWISGISKEALNSIRNYLDFADSAGMTLGNLLSRMEDYGSMLFEGGGAKFIFYSDLSADRVALTPMKSFSLYLIFKESITNILKHSKAQNVTVSVNDTAGGLELSIKDDGIGYSTGQMVSVGHHGITNITAWAKKIGGRLEVDSGSDRGTHLRLQVPL